MKRAILVLAVALIVGGTAWSDVAHYKQVSATATSQTIPLGAVSNITIYNAGANEIYFRLFGEGEATSPAVATAAGGTYLAAGGTLEYPSGLYGAISIICDTAETATVHLYLP